MTTTRTIYRVQHATSGIGPYNHESPGRRGEKLENMAYSHNDRDHPAPWHGTEFRTDEARKISTHHRFGFESVDAMKEWFRGYRAELRRCGFVLAVYEVSTTDPDAFYGRHQVAFDPVRAVLVRTEQIP
jgi:hypothetical protein